MSTSAPFARFVFVDFENVPSIDLAPIEGKPVHVTLLLGEKQRRLEVTLVRQILRLAGQVRLVEVGASGRNALDLVLAAHLGRGTIEFPGAEFTIVSKDKDFDPLVAHLRATSIALNVILISPNYPFSIQRNDCPRRLHAPSLTSPRRSHGPSLPGNLLRWTKWKNWSVALGPTTVRGPSARTDCCITSARASATNSPRRSSPKKPANSWIGES